MPLLLRNKSEIKPSAFSLIEVGIVVLIIGIIVAGIIQGGRMMKKAKITSARAMTVSSSVNFIKDLDVWYDSVSEKSLVEREADNNHSISSLSNITETSSSRLDSNSAIQSNTSNQPTYVDGSVSSLPLISFGSTSSLSLPNGSLPTSNSAYTVFFVVNSSGGGTILNSGSGSNNNIMGFDAGGNFTVSGSGGSFSTPTNGNNYLQIVTHSYDGTTSTPSSNSVWVNGVSQTISSITGGGSARTTSNDSITIGATSGGFSGRLGEMIVFHRNLDDSERQDIEKYLAKKWGIKIGIVNTNTANTNAANNNNSVTCNVTGTGIAANTTVTQNATTITCNASGYNGTATLSEACAGSALTATGCIANSSITCNVSFTGSITGNATTVSYGATTVSCPSGYNGTGTLSSTCATNGQNLTCSSGCTASSSGNTNNSETAGGSCTTEGPNSNNTLYCIINPNTHAGMWVPISGTCTTTGLNSDGTAYCRNGFLFPVRQQLSSSCAALAVPANGTIAPISVTTSSSAIGSSAIVQCNPGYAVLNGVSPQVICGFSGWNSTSGGGIPVCQSAGSPCPTLTAPTNGTIIPISATTSPTPTYGFAALVCDPGYSPSDNPQYSCFNGTWSSPLETVCQPSGSTNVACPALIVPENGTISPSSAASAESPAGTKVTLTCNSGYDLYTATNVSAGIVICGGNDNQGQWSGTLGPCVPSGSGGLHCPALGAYAHGTLYPSSATDTTMPPFTSVMLNCDTGYSQQGELYMSCGTDGIWSGDVGSCQAN